MMAMLSYGSWSEMLLQCINSTNDINNEVESWRVRTLLLSLSPDSVYSVKTCLLHQGEQSYRENHFLNPKSCRCDYFPYLITSPPNLGLT